MLYPQVPAYSSYSEGLFHWEYWQGKHVRWQTGAMERTQFWPNRCRHICVEFALKLCKQEADVLGKWPLLPFLLPFPPTCNVDMAPGAVTFILDCEVILSIQACVRINKDRMKVTLPASSWQPPSFLLQKRQSSRSHCEFSVPFCYM